MILSSIRLIRVTNPPGTTGNMLDVPGDPVDDVRHELDPLWNDFGGLR
jgi:hypothetical protein